MKSIDDIISKMRPMYAPFSDGSSGFMDLFHERRAGFDYSMQMTLDQWNNPVAPASESWEEDKKRIYGQTQIEPYSDGMRFGEFTLHGNQNTAVISMDSIIEGLQIHHHNLGGGSLNYLGERITVLEWDDKYK